MKRIFVILIVFLVFCLGSLKMQSQPFKMESEYPITMTMTPIMNIEKSSKSVSNLNVVGFNEEGYKVDLVLHALKAFTYGLAVRMEDGISINEPMKFFRNLSFFDIRCDYSYKKYNFSMFVSNLANFKNSIVESEPFLVRKSLVVEEIYFNHEVTSMINVSVQYRF